jgi:hypothetical protein
MNNVFKWKKIGKIFDPKNFKGKTWMQEFAQSPSAIVEGDRIRIFFCSRSLADNKGNYISYISYLDLDPKNMIKIINICKKPILELGELGTFDEFGATPVSVIKYKNKLFAYYSGWTRCESVPYNCAIGLAISDDFGENFKKVGNGPVLSYTYDEPFLIGSPRIRRFKNFWQLWYVAGKKWLLNKNKKLEPVYKIRLAISKNGYDWKKIGKDIIKDKIGKNECQASPDVFFKNNLYHMFFSYRSINDYKTGNGGYKIGYAYSNDMHNWTRIDKSTNIKKSDSGWDSKMISYPNIFEYKSKIYMLYQGNGMGKSGFGIAVLEN